VSSWSPARTRHGSICTSRSEEVHPRFCSQPGSTRELSFALVTGTALTVTTGVLWGIWRVRLSCPPLAWSAWHARPSALQIHSFGRVVLRTGVYLLCYSVLRAGVCSRSVSPAVLV
jgi:hypothetical protein